MSELGQALAIFVAIWFLAAVVTALLVGLWFHELKSSARYRDDQPTEPGRR